MSPVVTDIVGSVLKKKLELAVTVLVNKSFVVPVVSVAV